MAKQIIEKAKKIFAQKEKKTYDSITNINQEKKFIFVHIPKNAGTSVYHAFGMQHSFHLTAIEYKKMMADDYTGYFSFCFVRNPFDRFISLYNYARMDESYYHSAIDPSKAKFGKHEDYDLLKHATIDEAVDYLLEGKLRSWDGGKQWHPQVNWILDEQGNIIVDYIGRVENMRFDFRNICKRVQWPQDAQLSQLNRSSEKNIGYQQLINTPSRKKLESYYQKDLELLGYSFEYDNRYFTGSK